MISVEESILKQSLILPNKIAIKSGKDSVSYHELWQNILAAKKYITELSGFEKGKSVIIAANKQIEFVYAYFGSHLAGLEVAPIDAETNPTRFQYIAESIQPFCVIGFDKIDTSISKLSLKEFNALSIDGLPNTNFPSIDDTADILFTTGTTGRPKGVLLSYRNEASAALNINTFIQNKTEDVEVLALPVSHSFGLGRLRCCLTNGQTVILLGSFVNVKRIFRTLEEEKATGFSMVPSSWKFLQKMSGKQLGNYANQLKYIEMGSAYFSKSDKMELAELLPNTRICMHYGLTEASRSAFMEFHKDADRLDSVGCASPNTDIQIFDDKGSILPINGEGEICIKGDHVTKGYLGLNTDDFFFDQYFRTGDLGSIDEYGYIHLKSRIKELINVGGKKVAPQEVDDQILKIEGVVDCACTSAPDPDGVLGEVVKAYIVKDENSNLTFEQISNALLGKLESYKIPVIYAWIDAIPKTKNGKIQRNLLK